MAVEFPDTHWSQLVALGDGDHPRRAELLARLAERYWAPIYHYVRARRRVSFEDAQDYTQQFFTHLLEGGRLDRLSPERGSFRGFLKTSLRNFLVDSERAARARPMSVPFYEAEASWQAQPDLSPDEAFDRAWERAVLAEAIELVRDELREDGRDAQLAIFDSYCLADSNITYREVALAHGVTEFEVGNRLKETRLRLRQIVRGLLRQYLDGSADVEAELALILGQ